MNTSRYEDRFLAALLASMLALFAAVALDLRGLSLPQDPVIPAIQLQAMTTRTMTPTRAAAQPARQPAQWATPGGSATTPSPAARTVVVARSWAFDATPDAARHLALPTAR